MSPDGGLCTLIGIGRSSVYSLRLTGGKYRRVVAQLYQGASPDDLFREHGEITRRWPASFTPYVFASRFGPA
jgi:hypothetical protein